MGQKVNPHGFRVGPTLSKNWDSIFYAETKDYSKKLMEDLKIRGLIKSKYHFAQVADVILQRYSNKLVVNIYARNPGGIIGRNGVGIEKLKRDVQAIVGCESYINIHEVKKPALNASIIAQSIGAQLLKRVSYKRAMKFAIKSAMFQGAKGIKIECSGRLGGIEIARSEWHREGRVPLHTLKAQIDYSLFEVVTTYGVIGIKVWVHTGDDNKKRRIYS